MSANDHPLGWHVVRVTIEAVSPLSCASGQGQESDIALVRDANGLPTIPGTTLQGLLRPHLPSESRDDLFGRELGKGTVPARLFFGNAIVHDSRNSAEGAEANLDDTLLARLGAEAPVKREHVRLDLRHGAASGGKFDRAAVPAGTRFSFEVLMRGRKDEKDYLAKAFCGLIHPLFRIGGSGRKGFGRIAIAQGAGWAFFRPDQAHDFRKLRAKPVSDRTGMAGFRLAAEAEVLSIQLDLQPVQPWRTGQGPASHALLTGKKPQGFDQADPRAKAVDLIPLREARIEWPGGAQGAWLDPSSDSITQYLLPASGIRGPLLHRTIYHWNRMKSVFADEHQSVGAVWRDARSALDPLFGFVAEGDPGDDGPVAGASILFIDDAPLEVKKVVVSDHIRLDGFTGSVVQGALYSQELVQTPAIRVSIALDAAKAASLDDGLRKAFLHALRDLAEGRLALGAKSLAFCKIEVEPKFAGRDAADWLEAWAVTKRPLPNEEAA